MLDPSMLFLQLDYPHKDQASYYLHTLRLCTSSAWHVVDGAGAKPVAERQPP